MLTPRQFEILSYLHSCPDYTALHSALVDRFGPAAVQRVAYLISLGLANQSHYYDTVRLTPKGLAAIDEYQSALDRQREQDAKEHENARADALKDEQKEKQSFRHNLLIAIISGLVTLAIEHCAEIVDFMTELVNRLLSLFH